MRRRGATMLEMLITLTIVSVVATLTALLLQRVSRATARTTLRTEMQQQALTAVQRLVTDLRGSCCSGVAVRSSAAPLAIAICPLSQPGRRAGSQSAVLNNGELLWSDFFQIYAYDSNAKTLSYREWPPGSPTPTAAELDVTKPRRLTPGRLADILNNPPARQMTLVSGLRSFEVSYPPGGSDLLLVQPLTIKLVLERRGNTGHTAPELFTYRRTVFMPEQR